MLLGLSGLQKVSRETGSVRAGCPGKKRLIRTMVKIAINSVSMSATAKNSASIRVQTVQSCVPRVDLK